MFGSLSRWNSACIAFVLIAVVYQCWNYMHFIYMDAGVSVRGQVDSYEASINESPSRFDEKPNSLKYVSTYTSISNNQSTHLLKANEKLHSLRIPIDIMKLGPFPFLPNYKNPCWRTSSGVLRCLPYFHLIGCVKCGSSDLFYRITRHPEVSDLIQKKEPKWIGGGAHHAHCCSFNDYLDMYKSAVDKDIAKNDSSGFHRCVLGDGSPGTLVNNVQWEVIKHPEEAKALNRSEPVFANADLIHHLNPGAKIILMLRNPIDRSWSAYQYFGLTSQKSQEDFHRLTVRSISDFQQCLSQNELRHCVYHSHNNVWPNIYHVHLQEYFRVFPRKQILVLNIESYSKDIRAAMEKVYAFLELGKLPEAMWETVSTTTKRNELSSSRRIGNMWNKTRELLQDFYAPYNKELVRLLGSEFDFNK
ncbi:carbohydrate sulfotransferase 15-like isoform X2 [Mya arenaria]|uniref:carbohydrate sulfotransferase 15-like isoform X2 n=1 Tax=Mya arenaria TaxID=6604 RepID=UPI0022E0D309|nr:carbohydrate sulfotransferase 15-like isoform X2 [Mya arenaria]